MKRTTIGLFGGTFDPIHLGHLRVALELKQKLALDEMRLLPCHIPPHRQTPLAPANDRLAMVQLALSSCADLRVDELELRSSEPSYSIHTLEIMRENLGAEISLCLALGMDSLVTLNSWHRWQDLLRNAHIIVAARPGWQVPREGELADYIRQHQGAVGDLSAQANGRIVIEELSLLPISSTEIRNMVAQGQSAQFLLPDSVWVYIKNHNLYGCKAC